MVAVLSSGDGFVEQHRVLAYGLVPVGVQFDDRLERSGGPGQVQEPHQVGFMLGTEVRIPNMHREPAMLAHEAAEERHGAVHGVEDARPARTPVPWRASWY